MAERILEQLRDDQRILAEQLERIERQLDGVQRWFCTLGEKVDRLEQLVASVRGEAGETRDLMAAMRDDDVVQRRAIADLLRRVEGLEPPQQPRRAC